MNFRYTNAPENYSDSSLFFISQCHVEIIFHCFPFVLIDAAHMENREDDKQSSKQRNGGCFRYFDKAQGRFRTMLLQYQARRAEQN